MQPFRCSRSSELRSDQIAGSATHVFAFLLIEHHGPWGLSAPRDSRLPADVRDHLRGHKNIRVLLIRRHHKAHRGSTYRVFLAVPRRRVLLTRTITESQELLDVDLAAISQGQLPDWETSDDNVYGVCTHGRHDVCCAERGRPVVAALTDVAPEEAWEVSHIGGDRFSANMVVLPAGLYYGRLEPEGMGDLVERHRARRLDLEHLRGRTTYPMAVQYAEIALRRHLGEDREDAIRVVARAGAEVILEHAEDTWVVTLRRDLEEPEQLTCSALRPSPVPVFSVVSIARA